MKTVALGKVAKIDRTVANDNECLSLPYVGLEHVEKERGHFADGFVPTPLNMLATNFRFTPKHVLYGKLRPYLNKVVLPSFDGVCTTEILPILPNEEKLDRTFLWAILLSPTFVNWATSQISGANLPRLDPKLLVEYEIPLPPLTEQKRIASLLARADRLRQLRRTAHDLGDALLQSVFLEMFGEPTINDKKWDKVEIAEVTESLDSRRVPVEASIRQTKKGQYPYYGASGIIDYVDEYLFDEETLLIGEDGANLISRSSPIAFIVNGKYWVNNHAHVLKMKNMNIQFLCYLINVTDLEPYVTGSAQPKLNASNMEKIRVINPPLSLQEEFAGVVARVESLRGRMGESTRQVEGLFESLLAEAFS